MAGLPWTEEHKNVANIFPYSRFIRMQNTVHDDASPFSRSFNRKKWFAEKSCNGQSQRQVLQHKKLSIHRQQKKVVRE